MLESLFSEDALLRLAMLCVVILAALSLPRCLLRRLNQTSEQFRKLNPFVKVIFGIFFFVFVVHGSFKQNSTNTQSSSLFAARYSPTVQSANLTEFAVRNWNIVGAWDDSFWCKFENEFVFPYATNHLKGVEVLASGVLWKGPFNPEVISILGSPVELATGVSQFSCEYFAASETNEAKYVYSWYNGLVNRETNSVINGRIELRRSGDILVATNGVEQLIPRQLPFEHNGFGQDSEWVAANFTNSNEILSVGYSQWVDDQVGVDLTNGLYKLTVTVPEKPLETTQLKVGDYSVAVTNAGEYVFLLEKGITYPLSVFPKTATNFLYAAVDNLEENPQNYNQARFAFPEQYGEWSEDVGDAVIIRPSRDENGLMLFKPILSVSPKCWNPSWQNQTCVFTAELKDVRRYIPRTYRWYSSGTDVEIKNPTGETTEIVCKFPYGESDMISLWLEATVVNERMEVGFRCPVSGNAGCDYKEYWKEGALTNSLPSEINVSAVPEVLIFDMGNTDELRADVACLYQVHNAGRITLNIENGSNCVVKDFDGNLIQDGFNWDVEENSKGAKYFSVKGINKSSLATGTVFRATYTADSSSENMVDSARVAMYQVNTVTASMLEPRSRRDLGVRERVSMFISPLPDDVNVVSGVEGGHIERTDQEGNQWIYIAPACRTNDLVRFSVGDVNHYIPFEVYEPTGYKGRLKREIITDTDNISGEYLLEFDVFFTPTNVAFDALEFMEYGMVSTNATGYFLDPSRAEWLDHSLGGANVWGGISAAKDLAGLVSECPKPWGDGGSYSWPIPIYWRVKSEPVIEKYLCTIEQLFSIDSNGTFKVSKFGYTGTCYTNRTHFVTKEFER